MTPETVEKRADFYAQDRTGSTLEICIEHEIKTNPKAVGFLIEIKLSDATTSRRQTIRLNGLEFIALSLTLQQKLYRADRELHEALGLPTLPVDVPNGFGHILDEPVEPETGSTAETARSIPMTPEAATQLVEKILDYFEAENAAMVSGSAIGDDDAARIEGEVS